MRGKRKLGSSVLSFVRQWKKWVPGELYLHLKEKGGVLILVSLYW